MGRKTSNDYHFTYTFTLTADCELYTTLKISGDWEVTAATNGDDADGILFTKNQFSPGPCTVAFSKYTGLYDVILAGTVAAGDYVMLGTDGTGGEQRFIKWTAGTDNPSLIAGKCVQGGASGETGYILQ